MAAKKVSLKNLTFRTAITRKPDLGYILATDTRRDDLEDPHAIELKWKAGGITEGFRNYNAHSLCFIGNPEGGLLDISEPGYYSVQTRAGMTSGDIIDRSSPPASKVRLGGFRSVAEIAGSAYAVGHGGMVYRLDQLTSWMRLDDGLPDDFAIEASHGFSASDIYAVGFSGEVWHYDGSIWTKMDIPTNRNLNAVKCVDNTVYAAGIGGMVIRGRDQFWEIVDQETTEDDIWDIESFKGQLFFSTLHAVYLLSGSRFEAVDFGADPPRSCYQLSAGADVMWSNGEFDIMSFDGTNWTRII